MLRRDHQMIAKPRRPGATVRRAGRSALCWTSLLMFGGCAYTGSIHDYIHNGWKVGPEYRTPWAAVEENWIDAYDERLHTELPRRNDWWSVFNDPQMARLIQEAYSQNLPLREAGLRVQEAKAQSAIAVGAFFPQQQEVFGQYRRRQISKTAVESRPLIATEVPRAYDRWSTGFDAAWELDFWGKFRRNIASAEDLYEASIHEYDDILVCLSAETAATYVELRTLQQRIQYAEANVVAQKGLLDIAQSRYKAGETDDLDVLQAEINVKNTEALIPELKAMARKAEIRLCVLRGTPPRDLTTELGIGPIPVAPKEVDLGMPADLLRRRPDVRKAERQVAAQSEQIGVAAADLLPQMSIRGSIGHSAEDFDDLWRSSSTTGIILPGFDWDVLNYGRLKNNVTLQKTKFEQRVLHYRQTVLRANADVERAVVSFLQAQSRASFLAESVSANEEAIKVASDQYRAGIVNFNEIFTLQSFLVQEQDALAVAQGDVSKSLIAIYKALGGGWEIRRDCLSHCHDGGMIVQEEVIQDTVIEQGIPITELEPGNAITESPENAASIKPPGTGEAGSSETNPSDEAKMGKPNSPAKGQAPQPSLPNEEPLIEPLPDPTPG